MADWRSQTTRFLRRVAKTLPPDSLMRTGLSKVWTNVLDATGKYVTVTINDQPWRLLNQYRKFSSTYEPIAFRLWSRLIRPGDTVWDVGANIGLYTMAAAQHVGSEGHVLSWEPTPETFSILSAHVSVNTTAGRCRLVQQAISDIDGELTFNIQADSSSNRIGGQASRVDAVNVKVRTLDHWINQETRPPQVVKIDIEGAEVLAFKGMNRLLSEIRPILLVAIHPQFMSDYGLGAETITKVLEEHEYASFDSEGRAAKPEQYNEYLLIPNERVAEAVEYFAG